MSAESSASKATEKLVPSFSSGASISVERKRGVKRGRRGGTRDKREEIETSLTMTCIEDLLRFRRDSEE